MSSSAIEDKKIYLHDDQSLFFSVDGNAKNNPYLKTFRHKDKEDVPYVDVDEFRQVFRFAYTDYKIRGFTRLEDGRYRLYSPVGGEILFDCASQKVTIQDVSKANYDFGHPNNGLYNDACLEWRFLKESKKTAFVKNPKPVEIDLNRYQLGIVDQDGHLYAPLSLVNHLIARTNSRSVSYNGRDFYADNLLGDAGLARAYSGKNGACISLQRSKFSRYHYDVVTPGEGEAYHYRAENVTPNIGKTTTCDLVFKTDGTCTAKTADSPLMPTFDFVGTWTKEGDMLSYQMKPADEEGMLEPTSDTIDLGDRSYYRVTTRSRSMAIAHYYDLCLDFDYIYGEKVFHGYASADELISRKGLKDALLSTDTATYYNALGKFLMADEMGDSHVTLRNEGFASLNPKRNLGGDFVPMAGSRQTNYEAAVARIGGIRSGVENYQISGETASILVPAFSGAYKEGVSKAMLQNVYTGDDANKMSKIGRAMMNDLIVGLGYFMNDVVKNENVKNIVFDLTTNLGGYVMWVPYFMAIITDDPTVTYINSIDGSIIESHYHADLDGDGVFGGPKDTFKGKYNFYVAAAGASFSAGNLFPTMVKNGKFATVIGERTAGGACGVASRADLTGYLYMDSGHIGFMEKQGQNYRLSEDGVEPDIVMDINTIADCAKLDAALKNLAKPA